MHKMKVSKPGIKFHKVTDEYKTQKAERKQLKKEEKARKKELKKQEKEQKKQQGDAQDGEKKGFFKKLFSKKKKTETT